MVLWDCWSLNGGDTRSRTEDQGFAIQCISHFAMSPFEVVELYILVALILINWYLDNIAPW